MKIAIDCGHTLRGGDTGAEGCGRLEQNCTREIGSKLVAKLCALGHDARIVSVDSASSLNASLSARVNNANNWGANLYVSIHLNAGGGRGTEVYTYKGREMTQARNVLNNICNDFGYVNRGLKGASLYVINHTNMPAMLIECCFIDSSSDMARYDAEKFANAICRGLTGQSSSATSSSQPSSGGSSNQSNGRGYPHNEKIRQLQVICGVTPDSYWGPQTDAAVRRLPLAGLPYRTPELTKWIQSRVGCEPDGIFGNITAESVKSWQRSHGLQVDGLVGYNTLKSLALA